MDSNWIKRNEKPKSVFNPLSTDFTAKYRDDDNLEHEYLIRSMEIESFPTYIADHMIKHLITEILNDRETTSPTDEQLAKIREEVEVSGL